jgi:hypothetical protein
MGIAPRDSELPALIAHPAAFLRQYRVPLLLLVAAATADALTTIVALKRYGVDAEVHLVQRLVIHVIGIVPGVPLAKLIQVFFVVLVAAWWRPWCRWIIYGCAALYTLAAMSNHFEWF